MADEVRACPDVVAPFWYLYRTVNAMIIYLVVGGVDA